MSEAKRLVPDHEKRNRRCSERREDVKATRLRLLWFSVFQAAQVHLASDHPQRIDILSIFRCSFFFELIILMNNRCAVDGVLSIMNIIVRFRVGERK